MSNETKRDVFLQLAKENRDLRMYDPESIEPKEIIELDHQDWIREYDAALPDDLPVIPKNVSSWIEHCYGSTNLLGILLTAIETYRTGEFTAWVVSHHESVARAWVLGVWRVEETGEIVKMEVKD